MIRPCARSRCSVYWFEDAYDGPPKNYPKTGPLAEVPSPPPIQVCAASSLAS